MDLFDWSSGALLAQLGAAGDWPAYGTILATIVPVFLLVVVGFGARKCGWWAPEADRSILKMVLRVFYPCLIFQNILGNWALTQGSNLLLAPVLGFVAVGVGFLVAWPIARVLFPADPVRRRTFIFCLGIFNYGYLPIPLMQAFFPPESLGVLLVFNVGVEMALWTVGIALLSGARGAGGWRHLLNPPLLAMGLALTLNALGGAGWIPEFVLNLIRMLAACAIPLGLLVSGCLVADFHRSLRIREGLRTLLGAGIGRLLLIPSLFLLFVINVPLTTELDHVLIVQAAMPAGVFPMVIVRLYQGDTGTAITIVVGTTLGAVFLLPLWLRVGFSLLS